MLTLVIGGSGSGKSAYAEQIIMERYPTKKKYYIATMQVYGEEGRQKVLRHQKLRAGKGFETIEKPRNLSEIEVYDAKSAVALLECTSNLVANEMFVQRGDTYVNREADEVVSKVMQDLAQWKRQWENLVIISNNIFEDGVCYDASTREYQKALGLINQKLCELSDEVIEVVVGIPQQIK